MRLIGGSYSNEGRIEIYNDNRMLWARVCDDDWDKNDADVACHEMGFSGADAVLSGGTFGQGNDPLGITSLGCRGGEKSLLDCQPLLYSFNCSEGRDAAVRCKGTCTYCTLVCIPLRMCVLYLCTMSTNLYGYGYGILFNVGEPFI